MVGFTDFIAPGLALIGGLASSDAAGDAADAAVAGNAAAIAEQQRQFDLTRADLAPFREQGTNALNAFASSVLGPLEESEAFKFRLQQGVNARDRSASARGKLLSGQQIRAIEEFGQLIGAEEAAAHLNRQAALAGVGQTAINATGQFGAGAAGNIGNALINSGAARGTGFVNQSNALNDSIQNAITLLSKQGVI